MVCLQDDSKEYKNLFTSDGLCPTLKDLDQIFDNSDDAASGDETVRLVSVPLYLCMPHDLASIALLINLSTSVAF